MARGNVVAVLVAGLFLASALRVSAGSVTFGSQVSGSDSAYAFDPNQQQTYSPPATPSAPPPTTPQLSPPTSPPTSPPPPPAVSPASGSGSCPENFTKNFDNTFKIFTDTEHVIVGAGGDSAEMLLDNKTGICWCIWGNVNEVSSSMINCRWLRG